MVLGLSETDAKRLLEKHGENRFFTASKPNILEIFMSNFYFQMILLLVAIAFLSTINMAVALTALAFILAMAVLETYRELQIHTAIAAVQSSYVGESLVIREGLKKRISSALIVPGDLVILERGSRVPADGVLIEGSCKADEAIFGRKVMSKRVVSDSERSEIAAFGKVDPSILLAGTFIVEGDCTLRVERTGASAKVAKSPIAQAKRLTMLERVERVIETVNPIVLLFAAAIFVVELSFGVHLLDAFAIAAAAAVAGIPQYIFSTAQAAFFLTLERISKRMAIRREDIVEKLARTTLIATEKARALTLGQPTVGRLWIDKADVEVTGNGWTTEGSFKGLESFGTLDTLTLAAAAATEAVPTYDGDTLTVAGDLEEGALAVLAMKNINPVQSIRAEYPVIKRKIAEGSLNIVTLNTPQHTRLTVLYGHADIVSRKCSHMMINGNIEKIDKAKRAEIERKTIEMSADGFHVLAISYAEKFGKLESEEEGRRGAKNTLLGLVGIYDPPRPEIKDIIQQCKDAGIKVVVLTEESETTAIQFARQLGILEKGKRAIIADELKFMKLDERRATVARTVVFAKATPEEEALIISDLKFLGERVTFIESIGSDTEAMNMADTAIAMDSSQDILKFNSAGILKNDLFYGTPVAIEESKAFYFNVERLFYSIFTLDFAILFFILLSAIMMNGQTLTLLQILLVNAIADSLNGIGLARQRIPENALIPIQKDKKFPSRAEFTFSFALSVYIAVVAFAIASLFPQHYLSVAVATLILSFVAVTLNFTTLRLSITKAIKSVRHGPVFTAAGVAVVILLAVLYSPLNTLFSTAPITLTELGAALAAALSIFVIVEIKKKLMK
jgi:Ca2+-transporting ATPase